jgi:2-dehydro-3-deoxyphosphogluconate aldolase/(4S)-4-hydroxy-2-oxoglutarate aldolase
MKKLIVMHYEFNRLKNRTILDFDCVPSRDNTGIRTVEYTNRGEAALHNFKKMREICDTELKGMYLGIGTIKNSLMAQTFIDAGADNIICPRLIEEVANVADKNNMLWIPGCMTSSEIFRAENIGAKIERMMNQFPHPYLISPC